MLVVRARVAAGAEVVSVSVRPRTGGHAAYGLSPWRVTLRYCTPDGALTTCRTHVQAAVPPGRSLGVTGLQVDGHEALITLQPQRPAPAWPRRGEAVTDRFSLPIRLQAWGVTAVAGVTLNLQATCRAAAGALTLRGTVRLTLLTPGAPLHLRIPFWRQAPGHVAGGLAWRAAVGVTGLHLKVGPGGLIAGDLVLAARCEGRPPAAGAAAAAAEEPPHPARVREVSGRIADLSADCVGPGSAMLKGSVQADVYWTDGRGRSRWTERPLPFAALVDAPGLEPGDRLEVTGALPRLTLRGTSLLGLAEVWLTALRPALVMLWEQQVRVEQVTGTAALTIPVEGSLAARDEGEEKPHGHRTAEVDLPLPGPSGGWSEAAVALATPEATVTAGTGRWAVRATLGGTPYGETPYPQPLRAGGGGTLPVSGALGVVASISRVDGGGVGLRVDLLWGQPLPVVRQAAPGSTVTAELALPAPVRRVWHVRAETRRNRLLLQALVLQEKGGLRVAHGYVDLPGGQMLAGALAHPVVRDGRWFLRIGLEFTPTDT